MSGGPKKFVETFRLVSESEKKEEEPFIGPDENVKLPLNVAGDPSKLAKGRASLLVVINSLPPSPGRASGYAFVLDNSRALCFNGR